MKTWLTVLWLCLAIYICFMALLSDLLVFKSLYDYSSPHFGWAELMLLLSVIAVLTLLMPHQLPAR